ncbi:methyltransferase, FxLD system [Sphaerisporangium sp. NPDC051017]|uniref:methyltransferase, FxLD system n=1 Tax=unclassified Sphaerisporangium TaxID=2630420 RepID=UPI0033F1A127
MTPTEETADPDRVAQLRGQAVEELIKDGTIVSPAVEAAMRTVPRHLFIPEVGPEEAYDPYQSVVTKRDTDGNALSSVSDMHVQAFMLGQAQITPGMNLLELGSGGYNAALMAELTGPSGRVTTVDIDEWVTDRASRMLDAAGYSRVNVVLADAEVGVPDHAPYDRILVTFGAWDTPPAWVEQLAEDGRLMVALRMRGLTRTVAFEKAGDHLVSVSSKLFGFVAVQGAGAHQAKLLVLRDGEVTLRFDDEFDTDPSLLEGAFDTPRVQVWSGAVIGAYEPLDTVQMWLATTLPGFCWVLVDPERDTGVVSPPRNRTAALAVVDGASFAYITTRTAENVAASAEFGVHAYGPAAAHLAEMVAEQLRVWSREHRGGPGPQYRIYPAEIPDDVLPAGRVIDKVRSRVVISWPQPASTASGQGFLRPPTR